LVPTDFSEYSNAALEYASSLAVDTGATLQLLHVHDTRALGTAMGEASYLYAENWAEERRRAEQQLKRITPTDPDVRCEHHMLVGIPDSDIVAFAGDHKTDLIVMASHGRTGLARMVMGSVAEAVMRRAPCPVLVVKLPLEAAAKTQAAPSTTARAEH
jgi:nucleotide-binding universal stress UspA family protein